MSRRVRRSKCSEQPLLLLPPTARPPVSFAFVENCSLFGESRVCFRLVFDSRSDAVTTICICSMSDERAATQRRRQRQRRVFYDLDSALARYFSVLDFSSPGPGWLFVCAFYRPGQSVSACAVRIPLQCAANVLWWHFSQMKSPMAGLAEGRFGYIQ